MPHTQALDGYIMNEKLPVCDVMTSKSHAIGRAESVAPCQRLAESKLVSTSANASLRRVFEPFVPGGHAHTDPKPVVHGVQNTEYA